MKKSTLNIDLLPGQMLAVRVNGRLVAEVLGSTASGAAEFQRELDAARAAQAACRGFRAVAGVVEGQLPDGTGDPYTRFASGLRDGLDGVSHADREHQDHGISYPLAFGRNYGRGYILGRGIRRALNVFEGRDIAE